MVDFLENDDEKTSEELKLSYLRPLAYAVALLSETGRIYFEKGYAPWPMPTFEEVLAQVKKTLEFAEWKYKVSCCKPKNCLLTEKERAELDSEFIEIFDTSCEDLASTSSFLYSGLFSLRYGEDDFDTLEGWISFIECQMKDARKILRKFKEDRDLRRLMAEEAKNNKETK